MQCVNNERQLGIAPTMHAGDTGDRFPAYPDWGCWGGQKGSGQPAIGDPGVYGAAVAASARPVNTYTANMNVYDCPGDIGDPGNLAQPATWLSGQSCFSVWGNSYLMPWRSSASGINAGLGANGQYGWSYYGIEAIGGDTTVSPNIPSMKTSEMNSNTKKIILVDWPGAPDRPLDQISAWHTVRGKGLFNMLYGDSYVEAYLFTADQRYPTTPWGATVNPGNNHW